ncbi:MULTISPECIES: hypothetical protein [Streptacidiphilus]|uniref:Uncharacterized protein n=1 Tax=Streptacidiphilus cavernicola TaxID=3342716 RepID=A0ABV6UWD0_9ACTN|nr:hypothetical protein [Streptacidiphilus jeojiense]
MKEHQAGRTDQRTPSSSPVRDSSTWEDHQGHVSALRQPKDPLIDFKLRVRMHVPARVVLGLLGVIGAGAGVAAWPHR